MKSLLKNLAVLALGGLLTLGASCRTNPKTTEEKSKTENPHAAMAIDRELLIGSWLDSSKAALHFTMLRDGTAHSDNMATLLYKKWRLEGNKLILTVESIGNGSSSTDEETYEIQTLTDRKMILRKGDSLMEFVKKK